MLPWSTLDPCSDHACSISTATCDNPAMSSTTTSYCMKQSSSSASPSTGIQEVTRFLCDEMLHGLGRWLGNILVPVPTREEYDEGSPLERLALVGGWQPGTVVTVTWGFFDESGEQSANRKLRRLTLGGFYAPWAKVKELCEKWREALKIDGLGSFHMKEIISDDTAVRLSEEETRENPLVSVASGEKWTVST